MTIRILNLYCGIGGNRKLWPDEQIEVTAVENNQDFFPNDKVIVADAHQYLLEHFKEFDFIWSSPPCPTHSRMQLLLNEQEGNKTKYPDMKLYEEIILLKHWFDGKWVVENVISYYDPLIKPFMSNNHYYWSNFHILKKDDETRNILSSKNRCLKNSEESICFKEKEFGFDLSNYDLSTKFKEKVLNNCVQPKMGLFVFDCAFKEKQKLLGDL